MSRLENVTGPVAYHAESPVWSLEWGGLRFGDLYRGDLLTLTSTGLQRLHVADVAAFHRPRVSGGYVLAGARSLMLSSEPDSVPETPLKASVRLAVGVRFNDGGCSPAGTLYAGTMAGDGRGNRGHLLRVTRDGCISTVLHEVGISKRLAFSPDGSFACYVDTATDRVDVFDNDEDQLARRRGFVERCRGLPSSRRGRRTRRAVCRCRWVRLGCRLERFVSAVLRTRGHAGTRGYGAGRAGERLHLRLRGPANLYITTSREGLKPGQDPQAGSLFGLDTGTSGIPVAPFGG